MRLTEIDIDLLRLCALDDWNAYDAKEAWARFRVKRGPVNEQALLTRLYMVGFVDASNRITLAGKVELWDADLRTGEQIARMAS